MNSVKNFRDNVNRVYRELGWTQDDLATASKLGRPTLNRILNDKAVPGLDTCESIANALGIPLEVLITEKSEVLA